MDENDELFTAVGHVCVEAASLEFVLAFTCFMVRSESEQWFVNTAASRKRSPLGEFRRLAESVAALGMPEHAQAAKLLTLASTLLEKRHRVVHSVMITELKLPDEVLEAWHPKADEYWQVVPADLEALAHDLEKCASEVSAFGAELDDALESRGLVGK